MTADDPRFDRPLYTVPQAAALVGMNASTFAKWAKGYRQTFPDRRAVKQEPVITAVEVQRRGAPTIPFIGLTEAMVVQAFRRTDLSLQRIRKALTILARDGQLAHPMATRRLYTDGARVLFDYAAEEGDGQLRLLTVVENGQRVFHEVITDYLERITFGDEWATEVIVPVTERKLLRIRPEVASGDPLFVHGAAPLSAVVSRYRAGESIGSLAVDYGVPADEVEEALRGVKVAPAAA